jgi:Cu-processing system permease protein
MRDAVRSRWLAIYAAFFLAATEGMLRYSGGSDRALVSLLSIALFVVPLVTLVLGIVYLYGAREFTELLLAQPVRRSDLFAGLYLGLTIPSAGAFLLGVGIPFLVHGVPSAALVWLLGVGAALTGVFTAMAFFVATRAEDRLRGLGVGIGLWLAFGLLYDGFILAVVAFLADYPLERPLLALTFANPIDLARVVLLMQLDVSALMGYTGAVFQRFFSGGFGTAVACGALLCWIILPTALGARAFARKDF